MGCVLEGVGLGLWEGGFMGAECPRRGWTGEEVWRATGGERLTCARGQQPRGRPLRLPDPPAPPA